MLPRLGSTPACEAELYTLIVAGFLVCGSLKLIRCEIVVPVLRPDGVVVREHGREMPQDYDNGRVGVLQAVTGLARYQKVIRIQ